MPSITVRVEVVESVVSDGQVDLIVDGVVTVRTKSSATVNISGDLVRPRQRSDLDVDGRSGLGPTACNCTDSERECSCTARTSDLPVHVTSSNACSVTTGPDAELPPASVSAIAISVKVVESVLPSRQADSVFNVDIVGERAKHLVAAIDVVGDFVCPGESACTDAHCEIHTGTA